MTQFTMNKFTQKDNERQVFSAPLRLCVKKVMEVATWVN